MVETVEQYINQTVGEEHIVPCVKCIGKTAHNVLTSVDVHGHYEEERHYFSWSIEHQIIQCRGCKSISFRTAESNSEAVEYEYIGGNKYEPIAVVDEKLYPSRVEGRKCIGDETYYFPPDTKRIYDETIFALLNQAPVLAGIGLRALLETICKEKNATEGNLQQKIEKLVELQILTPSSAKILHKIRTLGNAAAHEVKPHTENQLGLAMDIIEHLLKEVYILPNLAESEFDL